MDILHPATLSDALAALREPGARAVAGGTALQVDWSQGKARPDILVTLGALGLDTVQMTEGQCLRIGATVTLDALDQNALVAGHLPLLACALRDVAAPSVRRLATLGGQLGWGNGCLLPALLALGARVGHTTEQGPRDTPLAQWLAAPAGLVLWLDVPVQPVGARWCWRKVGLRAAFTPSIIAVAGLCALHMAPDWRRAAVRCVLRGCQLRRQRWKMARICPRCEPCWPMRLTPPIARFGLRRIANAWGRQHWLRGWVLGGVLDRARRPQRHKARCQRAQTPLACARLHAIFHRLTGICAPTCLRRWQGMQAI